MISKETSHVMNGIIFCVCFNMSHFSSFICSEVMSKRTQKDAGEERVTAKSNPMMNWVSWCSESTLDVLASAASERSGRTKHERSFLLSSWFEQHLRTGGLDKNGYSSSCLEWNADKNGSSQEWKCDELMQVKTGRFVHELPLGLFTEHMDRFIDDDDDVDSVNVAESYMSSSSRSFLRQVNDPVRKMLDQSIFQRCNTRQQ